MKTFLITYSVKDFVDCSHCIIVAQEEECIYTILKKWDDGFLEIVDIREIKNDIQNVIDLDKYTIE
jgi:hypothetical protein